MSNVKAVNPNIAEAGTKPPTPAEVRKMIAALQEQSRQLLASLPAASAEEKAQIENARYRAFAARKSMEPFEAENDAAIAEHLELTGLSKIKFSEEEREKFTSRFQNENKAAAKSK